MSRCLPLLVSLCGLAIACGSSDESAARPPDPAPRAAATRQTGPLYGVEDLEPWLVQLAALRQQGPTVTVLDATTADLFEGPVSHHLRDRLRARLVEGANDGRLRWLAPDPDAPMHVTRFDAPGDLLVMQGPNAVDVLADEPELDAAWVERLAARRIDELQEDAIGRPCLVIGGSGRTWSPKAPIERRHAEIEVAGERAAARARGCAYFDTYAALGPDNFDVARTRPFVDGFDSGILDPDERARIGTQIADAIVAACDARSR